MGTENAPNTKAVRSPRARSIGGVANVVDIPSSEFAKNVTGPVRTIWSTNLLLRAACDSLLNKAEGISAE